MESNQKKEKVFEKARRFEKSPWVFLIRKSKLTILIIISLLIFGSLTINNLPRELNPEVEIPYAVVFTAYPGASPANVEEQVTEPIENEITDLTGVKRIDSSSSLGVSSITIEFEAGEDLDKSLDNLKDHVEIAQSELPEDATDPQVIEINIQDEPIFTATLASNQYDVSELKEFAENLKEKIKGISNVSDVIVSGGSEEIIEIKVDQAKASRLGISISQINQALSSNNVNFPIGPLETEELRYNVRLEGELEDLNQIASLPIFSTPGGEIIYLEDVASVRPGFTKELTRSRLSQMGQNPEESVSIHIYKKTGGDITKLTEEVRQRIEAFRGEAYPENLTVLITNDFSEFITDSLSTLIRNGLQTVIFILILLFIFLGWRESLLAGPAIPFSFFIAFIIMSVVGESLNTLSLFSLVLSLGLLVDSTVVIVEGMYNKVSRFGFSGYWAAISTIQEYAAPLLSGMLTTVAAFFPLLFVKGIFGEFMQSIPIVVISTLFAALFVSISIIPAFGIYLIHPIKKCSNKESNGFWCRMKKRFKKMHSKPRKERVSSQAFEKMKIRYYNFMPRILGNKKVRRRLIGGAWLLLFISFLFPIFGLINIQSFSEDDSDFFYINLEMPNGTTLEKTDEAAQKIEPILQREPLVENFVTSVGSGTGVDIGSSSGNNTSKAFFQVNLIDEDLRKTKSYELVKKLRKELENEITEGKISFIEVGGGPPAGSPIEARVTGNDLLVLEELAENIKSILEDIPGTVETETSFELSPGDLIFVPNKEVIFQKGLTPAQVASELRNGISKNDDVEITQFGEEIKIETSFNENQRDSFEDIKDITISTPQGEILSLSELGEIKISPALSSIRHRDGERVATITSGVQEGNVAQINALVEERVSKEINIPNGYTVSFGGETQELNEVYMDMFLKMLLGIVLILFILVLQFNSYKQVLIILFTIPLAMIGVFWGMTIFRLTLDIPAFIGIVSLSGIVINNAIILIDQINREFREKNDLIESARSAGRERLRPIFLTTITTVIGLLPLSISQPIWRNLGFAIIFGLLFSTILTLVIVPTMYVSFYKKKLQ